MVPDMNDTQEQPEVLTEQQVKELTSLEEWMLEVSCEEIAALVRSHEALRARCAALARALEHIAEHGNLSSREVAREALAAAPTRDEKS